MFTTKERAQTKLTRNVTPNSESLALRNIMDCGKFSLETHNTQTAHTHADAHRLTEIAST